MATFRLPILNATVRPDDTGDCFWVPISSQLTLTNATAGKMGAFLMRDGSADAGVYGTFEVPQNYAGSPVIAAQFVLDGAPSGTTIGVTCSHLAVADDESWDQLHDTADTASAGTTWSHGDEDLYEEQVTITPAAAWNAGEMVQFFFAVDISVTDYTGNLLLVGLYFQYSDT